MAMQAGNRGCDMVQTGHPKHLAMPRHLIAKRTGLRNGRLRHPIILFIGYLQFMTRY